MFITILIFIVVLSVLVFAHELGHFWVAKWFGLKPEEFGWGLPPRAWGFYRSKSGSWKIVRGSGKVEDAADTIYSANWLPIGGFVKLGEDDAPGDDPNHFNRKKPYQRAAILAAGVTMNVLLAAVLLSIGFMIGLPQVLEADLGKKAIVSGRQVRILEILPGSPAEKSELEVGDIVEKINNEPIDDYKEMQDIVDQSVEEELAFAIKRGTKELELKIKSEYREDIKRGGIGVAITETGLVRYPFFWAIAQGFATALALTWAVLAAFGGLVKGLFMGQGVGADLAGPVGIAAMTGEVARLGFAYLLQFAAILSINLAIINALPFPALDGGRILFLLIEKIKGSPVRKELEGTIHYIGFAILMVLILVVTFRDVAKHSPLVQGLLDKIF